MKENLRSAVTLSMSPVAGVAAYFVGFIISVFIRAPFEAKSKKVATITSQRDGLEVFLLVMMPVGLVVVPFVYALTDVFPFADHLLTPWAYWLGIVFLSHIFGFCTGRMSILGTNWSVALEIKDKHELITSEV